MDNKEDTFMFWESSFEERMDVVNECYSRVFNRWKFNETSE